MVKRNKRKKEEVAEDYCFKCKDGGHLLLCDYGDCLKAYHPQCVENDSFLESDDRWTCGSHSATLALKDQSLSAFAAQLLSVGAAKNADVDSDGKTVNFKAQDTYECLFSEYYEIIKKEEGLNSLQVHSAYNFFKNCKKKCGVDPDEIGEGEDDTEESEDGSNFTVSNCDDLNDTAGVKSVRKKNRDTSREFSEHDVASIIIEYCKEKKLFDSEKKRKVNCDDQLKSLLGRKSVNKNNIHNLLAPHFKENFEEMDDISSSPEDRDDNEPFDFSRERKLISSTKSCQKLVSEERQSCFAAIVSSNLKLVYLKRSLMEELLKQPETFDGKVLGSFVRIKSNLNDYL
ncbi:Zinc finger, PHD-type [Sesbania bispinosa]|nr:Zinc finger, PHD-type [Sesbania bispinosa]